MTKQADSETPAALHQKKERIKKALEEIDRAEGAFHSLMKIKEQLMGSYKEIIEEAAKIAVKEYKSSDLQFEGIHNV